MTQESARGREDRAVHAQVKGAKQAELGAGEGESKGTQKRWIRRRGEGRYL
jgi:hypothetical protein